MEDDMKFVPKRRLAVLGTLLVLGCSFFFANRQDSSAGMNEGVQDALDKSKYVYIQTERKDGTFGSKAEIWFMEYKKAIWVASMKTTYRARRIAAGRARAKIWVGSRNGPLIEANGAIVEDPAINEVLFERFAGQYPDGWPKYESRFRQGLTKQGSYVLIKYTPTEPNAKALPAEVVAALDASKYIYIQSERKDGTFGSKAEIWFMHHDGAIWIGTPMSTYPVKRIIAGRTRAKVWVGSPEGPDFNAEGSLVKDLTVNDHMYEIFAQKYGGDWTTYETRFQTELADGSRTLLRYVPTHD